MLDAESLILEVQKWPCIWLVSNNNYMRRDEKDKAWEEIWKEIFPENENEKKESQLKEIKKKWTNIRDSYRKYKKEEKDVRSGQSATKKKKYVYADILNFLDPVLELRSTEGNYMELSGNEDSLQFSADEFYSPAATPSPPVPLPQAKKRGKEQPTLQRKILEILKSRQIAQNAEEDSDKSFLLSFLSDTRNFKEIQKMQFKRGMLDLVQNIKFPLTSTNLPPQSSQFSHSILSGFQQTQPNFSFCPNPLIIVLQKSTTIPSNQSTQSIFIPTSSTNVQSVPQPRDIFDSTVCVTEHTSST